MPEQLARRASAPVAASVPAPVLAPPAAPAFHVETVKVTHSFSEAADQLGIDAATVAKLAHALEGRVDFRRDLRPGSEVRFVFRNDATAATATAASAASGASDASATPVAMRISTGKESTCSSFASSTARRSITPPTVSRPRRPSCAIP
jgi:hypothetical protein